MKKKVRSWGLHTNIALSVALLLGIATHSYAADKVRVAAPHKTIWDTGVWFGMGQKAGFFKAEGIDLELTYTRGSAVGVQMLIIGEADVSHAGGLLAPLKAYVEGAPIRLIGAEMTGSEFFWYARTDSGIRGLQDFGGKTLGHNMPGTSAHISAMALKQHTGLAIKLVMAGRMGDNITQTLSGQIDIGYAVPPFAMKLVGEGKLRIVAYGRNVPSLANRTTRAHAASLDFVTKRRAVAVRYMRALNKSIDYVFEHKDESTKLFAKLNKLPADAAKMGAAFYKREMFNPLTFNQLDVTIQEAVNFGALKKPLSKEKLDRFIDIVYVPGKS